MLGTVSQARLCARAQPFAHEWLLRVPWLGVFWDRSSSWAWCSHSAMPPSNVLCGFLGRALVGSVSQAGLCASAQPYRPRIASASSLGSRWLGLSFKRSFVLTLSKAALECFCVLLYRTLVWKLTLARLCNRAHHAVLDWFLRFPEEGVGWDNVSSGAFCSRSTMPSSIGLCYVLESALVEKVFETSLCTRAQPCRRRMACAKFLRGRCLGRCILSDHRSATELGDVPPPQEGGGGTRA